MNENIIGLGHVAYNVKDMEASIKFYCDGLGFERAFDLSDSEGKPWIVYLRVTPTQFVELFYSKNDFDNRIPKSYAHLSLQIADLKAYIAEIESKGIKITIPYKQGSDLNYQAWVADPDGNPVELMQLHPDSPHMTAK